MRVLPFRALLVTIALSAPLAAQTPERVMGAQYHNPSRAFIDVMIPHHQMAIMMSEHAQKAAKTAEVKNLARRMLDTQKKEVEELKAARKALFGSDSVRKPMMGDMMQMMHQMEGAMGMPKDTAHAGRQMMPRDSMKPGQPHAMGGMMAMHDVDRMFLTHMIDHHREGADLSVLAEDSQAAARVKELAKKIRDGQERDIAEMRRVLAALPPAAPAHKH